MKPHDANGVEVRVGDKVLLTGVVELVPADGPIRIRADRQPEGYDICPWISPRVLEVVK